MTLDEAAQILSRMYTEANKGEKVIQIHLFGIKYADQIKNMSPLEIAIKAGISPKYRTEINKGRNLSRFVSLRD